MTSWTGSDQKSTIIAMTLPKPDLLLQTPLDISTKLRGKNNDVPDNRIVMQ